MLGSNRDEAMFQLATRHADSPVAEDNYASPHTKVYSYEFADPTAPHPAPIFDAPGTYAGAAHTKELSYLFHQNELTPKQRQVSDRMIRYWTNFATSGDPNGPGLPSWPSYRPERPTTMTFGSATASAGTELSARSKCTFWAEQGFATLAGPYATAKSSGSNFPK
ncbi:carboxylesterase family protein [Streptomyces sp. NPDC056983]|uniref:carboxylesterase family protein n=1 Tax=Streptomyces sp. NPDC056983 TaxID=3345987 RepID=UPI00363F45F9